MTCAMLGRTSRDLAFGGRARSTKAMKFLECGSSPALGQSIRGRAVQEHHLSRPRPILHAAKPLQEVYPEVHCSLFCFVGQTQSPHSPSDKGVPAVPAAQQGLGFQATKRIQGTMRDGLVSVLLTGLAVALTLWLIDPIGFRRVADISPNHFLTLEPEARLLFRPVDDEGNPDRLPTMTGIEPRHSNVAIAIGAA